MKKGQETKLLHNAIPCPFCSGTDLVLINASISGVAWSVGCMGCHAGGPIDDSPEKAVELWDKAKRKDG